MATQRSESQNGEYLTSIKPRNALQQFPHIESIEPFLRPPWWTLKAKTRVDNTKDIVKDTHDKTQEPPDVTTVAIYTDGSGIDKKIGAAALNSTTGEVSRDHLGGETQFNVYTAEITALQLAIERLWNHQAMSRCRMETKWVPNCIMI
jgi:hypothetical protein